MVSILGERYASIEMHKIWSREFKVKAERNLWLAVLETQISLGLQVDIEILKDYKNVVDLIDLKSIDSRELATKHDVKARIDEFNSLAGHEAIHIGMTSRDLTENVETFQMVSSINLVRLKVAALLYHLAKLAQDHIEVPIVARTHNVPAQLTTLGRRFAIWIEELLFALQHLQDLLDRLPIKGIKGPIGTSQDLSDLFGDSSSRIEKSVAALLALDEVLEAPSQIYPRSIDYEIVTTLVQLSASPSNIATNVRIMSGYGLVSEGFEESQIGSSAMPHKVNPRLSERVNSLTSVLKGNAVMVQELVGNQWNEGDVSCSVVRRVALSDSFYAIDAILDTTIRIVRGLVIDHQEIKSEVDKNLPFLTTTRLMSLILESGKGREEAYSVVKKHVISARENLKRSGFNNFYDLIQADKSLGIEEATLSNLRNPQNLIGRAKEQTEMIINRAITIANAYPDSLTYKPEDSV